jgi:hypothetical protein
VSIIGVLLSGETSYCSEYDSLSPSIDADIGYMEHTATPTYAVAYRKQVRWQSVSIAPVAMNGLSIDKTPDLYLAYSTYLAVLR